MCEVPLDEELIQVLDVRVPDSYAAKFGLYSTEDVVRGARLGLNEDMLVPPCKHVLAPESYEKLKVHSLADSCPVCRSAMSEAGLIRCRLPYVPELKGHLLLFEDSGKAERFTEMDE